MKEKLLKLLILSPEKTLYEGEAASLLLPGEKAPFTVLYNHAPVISSLIAGEIVWSVAGDSRSIAVSGGFVEVNGNCVTACVETALQDNAI